MRLGDIANAAALDNGKPLDGVRILAAEQMQALPFATQLLARLGADVVKVEHPVHGESGRGSSPAMTDPAGRSVGATYLRNNLGKRSVGIDLKTPEGQDLFCALIPQFDVVAENFKAGTMQRLGLGYDDLADRFPEMIYVSLTGFGNGWGDGETHGWAATPYRSWPAYASVVEAMSGIYEYKSGPDAPPVTIPVGALGDISSALFAAVGILAALRHRDRTGKGQYVDIAMLDAVIAMTDVVTNFWSLGVRSHELEVICEGFKATDGYVVCQIVREPQFFALGDVVGRPDWRTDERFATRAGWRPHLEAEIRPAVEAWMADKTKLEAAMALTEAGIVAGPSNSAPDVIADPARGRPQHAGRDAAQRRRRGAGADPGNPVKLSAMAEGPETRVPWVGEHTDEVLAAELGLDAGALGDLRARGVIGG
ncbi:MAG: CaiB/BaiF CoA-transferase family protein [Acidimicrobiales bacterium]